MMSLVKHIPNTITSMNLLSGLIGVIFVFSGRQDLAFLCMLAAAVFDFCDGLAARALHAYSDIGKELDSLSDLVSFGVLPSLMLYSVTGGLLRYVTLLLAVFSALRLAKFNLDERQHSSFIGLPTPACAIICGSLVCSAVAAPESLPATLCSYSWFPPLLALCLSVLLVSEVPMFAMKFGGAEKAGHLTVVKRSAFISIVIAILVVTLVLGLLWSEALTLIFASYVLMNLILSLFKQEDF